MYITQEKVREINSYSEEKLTFNRSSSCATLQLEPLLFQEGVFG